MNIFWTIAFVFISVVQLAFTSRPLILTHYIVKNETGLARNLSRVDPALFLNVTSHSGFLTVDAAKNSNIFFWYFPVAKKPLNDAPWIIWLQGGPGATSMAGLFDELGPFSYNKELKLRQSSWGKEFSLLFIDNPVGAGYSFTHKDDGYVRNMNECSNHLYGALQQFLELFPVHRRAPLYIAGESYAGHFVPALAHKILKPPPELLRIPIKDTSINLKGLLMGNPIIDRRDNVDLVSAYYHWGLIDAQGALAARGLQDKYEKAVLENKEQEAFDLHNDLIDELSRLSYQVQTYNALKGYMDLTGFQDFVTKPAIREAIHVGNTSFNFSSSIIHEKLVGDFLSPMSPKVEELLEHYRILIYCGQLDLTVPCVPNSKARRKNWHWSHRDEFLKAPRLPWVYNYTVAGYVKSGGGFTEVLVRNAGHLVPMDKPEEAKELISYFIRGLDLPLPSNFNEKDIETPIYHDDVITPDAKTSPNTNGIVASAVLNVVLVLIIIIGVVYWVRWKRRTETFFYNMVDGDNASLSDGILTMN